MTLVSAARLQGAELTTDSRVYPPHPSRPNYLVRHWRGDLSLAVSYWVNGALIAGMVSTVLATTIFSKMASAGSSLRTISFVWFGVVILALVVWLWSVTGIWRSAGRHVSRGGSGSWSIAARAAMVLGVLALAGNLYTSILPQAREFGLIALGRDPLGKIKVNASANGQAVIVSGTIGEGSAAAVEAVLKATPEAKILALSSGGGRLVEAERLARIVHSRNLDTYVEDECASACTYVFLAGKERAATPNAKIGFHKPSFVGRNAEAQRLGTQAMMNTYRNARLPDAFIKRISETPPEDMWYPTRDELIAANVITRMSLGGEASTIGSVLNSKQELQLALRGIALWQAMEKRFPGLLHDAVEKGWEVKSRGGNDNEILNAMRSVAGGVFGLVLKAADDPTLDRFVNLYVDQMTAARAISGEACTKLMASQLDVTKTLPKAIVEQENQFLRQALAAPPRAHPLPSDQLEFQQAIRLAMAPLSPEHIRVVGAPDGYSGQPELTCDAFIAFYRGVSTLPERERHIALRGLFQRGN